MASNRIVEGRFLKGENGVVFGYTHILAKNSKVVECNAEGIPLTHVPSPKPAPEPEPEVEVEAPKAEAKPAPKAEPKPAPKAEPKPAPKAEPKKEPKKDK